MVGAVLMKPKVTPQLGQKNLHREAIHVEDLEEYAFQTSSHHSWDWWLKGG
jgi:hypothetical protein